MIDRNLRQRIQQSFSKAALSYDNYAQTQRIAAERLVDYVSYLAPSLPPGPVLEIGCGTGFVSEGLAGLFEERNFSITDLSSEMVAVCKKRLTSRFDLGDRFQFYEEDGESVFLENQYALIVSGFTFQWFQELEDSLSRLLRSLKSGGALVFSLLGADSFPEWKRICRLVGLPFEGNELPSMELLRAQMEKEKFRGSLWDERVVRNYANASEFFDSIKKTGASVSTSKTADRSGVERMKTVLKGWKDPTQGQIQVTYQVIYGHVTKD